MPGGAFQSQFEYFKLRNDAVWFEILPAISIEYQKNATDLSGAYTLVYPNPAGAALSLFSMFDNQELWFAHVPTNSMYRAMAGQITAINPTSKFTLEIKGRGLTGMLTDRKISDSWTSMRGDFIICDPTYGMIPNYYPTISTWNAFTDDYDRFDYWNSTRWGSQPAWADIIDGELVLTGNAAETRTVTDTDTYNFESLEFRIKMDASYDVVRFGFRDATGTNYVYFEVTAAACLCTNSDGLGNKSSATPDAVTQTNYNYYRLEWAPGLARFLVNGVLEISEVSNVPVALMSPFMELDNAATTLTADYVKAIQLTTLQDTYVANDKVAMDIVTDITDVGNSNTDFTFYIDDDYDFNAYPKKSYASGFSYGMKSIIYTNPYQQVTSLELNSEAKDMYNFVKIRGGDILNTTSAPNWTNQFTGNGVQTAFALGYKAKKPITLLEVDGVAKAENTDFTVTYGTEHSILQFNSAPANTKTVNIRYDYYTPIIATASNEASINTYGVTREYSEQDENITSQDRASNLANALLLFYSDPRAVIKVMIPMDPRIEVGSTVNIDAPYYGINNTAYEIIELGGTMSAGTWQAKLTLASSEINTSGEIIRAIMQQLKALKNRGDTNTIALDEKKLDEGLAGGELEEYYIVYVCDSFIMGHTDANGIIGRGTILEEFEGGVGSWSGTDCSLSSDSVTYRAGVKSMKLVSSASPFLALTTQSFGNLSAYTTVNSGAPPTGTLGIWAYCTLGTELTSVTLRIGSSSSDYTEVAGVKPYSGVFSLIAGWNYFVFRLKNGATAGTPDWTAVDYTRLRLVSTSTPTIYMDYFTIAKGDIIALNGMGRRTESTSYMPIALA